MPEFNPPPRVGDVWETRDRFRCFMVMAIDSLDVRLPKGIHTKSMITNRTNRVDLRALLNPTLYRRRSQGPAPRPDPVPKRLARAVGRAALDRGRATPAPAIAYDPPADERVAVLPHAGCTVLL